LGTGGGFPLLPLSIVLPNAKCVGVDAVQKKVDAVQRIVTGMNLKNVELICQRSERLAQAPEERRALFEEAAGIGAYRDRREDAHRKLEETRGNLQRARDILTNICLQRTPLPHPLCSYASYRRLCLRVIENRE
jgi:hypothetical protein